MLLAMNQHQFFRLGGYVDLLDLGPGSPGNGLSLAVPTWGVAEEARIKMLHGTTILAFKPLHGVIAAADSPVTAGASAASQTVKKGDRDQPIHAGHQGWRSWLSSDNSMSFKMHLGNSCLQAACQCGVSV